MSGQDIKKIEIHFEIEIKLEFEDEDEDEDENEDENGDGDGNEFESGIKNAENAFGRDTIGHIKTYLLRG